MQQFLQKKRALPILTFCLVALFFQNCEIQFGNLSEDQPINDQNIKVLVVDTANLDNLINAMEQAAFEENIREQLHVLEIGVANSLTDEQETYLITVADTIANDTLSVDFWQNSVRIVNNQFVVSPQLQAILDIAKSHWLALPFQAGLPVITTLDPQTAGLGKSNTLDDELVNNPYCYALTLNLEQLLIYLDMISTCPDPDFENCVDHIKAALLYTTDNLCNSLSRQYSLCLSQSDYMDATICQILLTVSVVYTIQQLWTISTANVTACSALCDPDCDDGNPCTYDYWDMEQGQCIHEAIPGCHDQGGAS